MTRPLRAQLIFVFVAGATCWLGGSGFGADVMRPLDLREVRVGGEIGRRIEITITNNLLVLDADRDFLPPFQARTNETGYIGLGKLIDATAKLAAYSGDSRVEALRRHLVAETIQAQQPDGYIGLMAAPHRVGGLWDVHEMGYLIYGLLTDYQYFGEERALAAACRAADYLVQRWPTLPADWCVGTDVAPHVAATGLERTMLALHCQTGEAAYLDFTVKTRGLPGWDLPIVVGRRRGIEGHVYAYLARCLAQLELHRMQPNPRLLHQTERALDFMLQHDGLHITGGTGQCEIWTDDQDGRGDLGETCATAYQLRVYDSLLRLNGDARMGDLIERTIFNTLFAAQSPDGRRLRYFAPTEGPRAYWPTDTYCCPCNYRRIVSELPAMVFYQTAGRPGGEPLHAGRSEVGRRQRRAAPHPPGDRLPEHWPRPSPARSGAAREVPAAVAHSALGARGDLDG